ncbi:MAG: type II secretion system F family protein [Nanoarchaeota archaeon]
MKKVENKRIRRDKQLQKNVIVLVLACIISLVFYYFYRSIIISGVSIVGFIILAWAYSFFSKSLEENARKNKMESVFPDFLQLMSSNLRAGMTISKAILLSAREEFSPLDKEILRVGKDITTGRETQTALLDMSKRIGSEKIRKTILLINSGISAGGNLSVLIEETASNMRERGFVEKRAASNVLMYVIFIFIAVAVAAPALFALSNVLVNVLSSLLKDLPAASTQASVQMPFTMTSISVSPVFINYFSIMFIIMLDVLASMVLGLVSKGEEKEGIRYLIPILILSLGIFFAVKLFLSGFLAGLF